MSNNLTNCSNVRHQKNSDWQSCCENKSANSTFHEVFQITNWEAKKTQENPNEVREVND